MRSGRLLFVCIAICCSYFLRAQSVNVFLGTSGDHGQLSPAASAPFGLLSIAPQTYPNLHAGYEYRAKQILGFTHNRMEGVGCRGSGGNILITPFIGTGVEEGQLIKSSESAKPGSYAIGLTNGIRANFEVQDRVGLEKYIFPAGPKGLQVDLSFALANQFIDEAHQVGAGYLSGWIRSGTTCRQGAYMLYYSIRTGQGTQWVDGGNHKLQLRVPDSVRTLNVWISFSAVDTVHASLALDHVVPGSMGGRQEQRWKDLLGHIRVTGDAAERDLFYSLLYRTLQSPYNITEPDGAYRANDGSLQQASAGDTVYNGWAIWDNYRTQLPLLALAYPTKFQGIANSIAGLYRHERRNWATRNEPSNSVRTEHAEVVLLDAIRKGFHVPMAEITDALIKENDSLGYNKPDKALETCYDDWALGEIFAELGRDSLASHYRQKAQRWVRYWNADFKDLSKGDIDQMGVRGMYQGTIWQYRWLVPYDVPGLMQACGGETAFIRQLDSFFRYDYYTASNETDIQVPYFYHCTKEPWRSQYMIRHYAKDTVVQYYYDQSYRGVDPTIDRIYNNRPRAFVSSMDDDAGAMSAWYVWAAIGLSPICPGKPIYYLHVPLFDQVTIDPGVGKSFTIRVLKGGPHQDYIQSVRLNGHPLNRNWLTHAELVAGGELEITAGDQPNKKFGVQAPAE